MTETLTPDPKLKKLYDTLAEEGGGTWATYVMIDVAEAIDDAVKAERHRLRAMIRDLADDRYTCFSDTNWERVGAELEPPEAAPEED